VIFLQQEKSDKTLMAQIAERILPYDSAVLFCINVTMDESV